MKVVLLKKNKVLIFLLISIATLIGWSIMNQSPKKILTVAFPSPWGQLTPGQQHTLPGSIILHHEFETLVKFDDQGILRCNLASEWSQSNDFRILTFKIDTNRRFSDGTELTSYQIKTGWLAALREESKATNHSMKDIFYNVVGFENFSTTNDLTGLETPDKSTLIIKFKAPFRTAIDHLNGVRFAATKKQDNKYIGTGPFKISKWDKQEVHFDANPLFDKEKSPFDQIIVKYLTTDEIYSGINNGTIDIAFGPAFASNTLCNQLQNVSCWIGPEALHFVLQVNGMEGRFFSSKSMRAKFQRAVYHLINTNDEIKSLLPTGFNFDNQVFLKTQAGRVDAPVNFQLKPHADIADLVAFSKKHPIKVVGSDKAEWFWMIFKKLGLTYVDVSNGKPDFDANKALYKDFSADIQLFAFSIIYGDPDGMYHAIGKNGAIVSKMIVREKVSDLLEAGRMITNQAELDAHYQKVTEAIWDEVPFVHMGFSRRLYLYNNRTIKPKGILTYRMGRDFSGFEPL